MWPARPAVAVALPVPAERTRDLFWPLVVGAAALAAIVPLWSSQLLPFQDAPQHVAAIRVLADYHSPAFGFERWFEIDLHRLQYLGFYLPAAAFSKFIGPEAACRLILSLIALAYPAAFWMLLGAFGRDRRLTVFSPLVFHSFNLYMGFFNFVESVPAAVAVVALTERQLHQPTRVRALVLAVAAAVLLWLHPSALAFAMGCAVIQAATSGQRARRIVAALASWIPATALLVAWMVQALAARDGVGHAAKAIPKWLPLWWRIKDVFRFGNVLAGHADEACVLLCAALFVAALVVPGKPTAERTFRLPLLAGLTLFAYFASPFEIGYMGYIEQRALPFFFLLALASFRISTSRVVGVFCSAAVVVQVCYSLALSRAYRAFDQEAESTHLEQVLREADRGETLLALVWDQGSRVVQFQPYMHFGSYYEVQRGGRARYNFAETPWTPVRFRKGAEPPAPARSWELHPDWVSLSRDAVEKYLLVRGPGHEIDPASSFHERATAGSWTLYSR